MPYLALFFVMMLSAAALAAMYPKELRGLVVMVDTKLQLNMTQEAKLEALRIAQIKELSIPYVEKEVLMKGRVFKGASTDMARLALGQPNDQIDLSIKGYGKVTVLVYLFDGSTRYTGLQFVGGELKGYAMTRAETQEAHNPCCQLLHNSPDRTYPLSSMPLP
jgi:hypothetical protein